MSRTNVVLLAVVVALALVVAVVEKPWKKGKPEGYVDRRPLIEDFDPSKVAQVILQRTGEKLVLAKGKDGKWVVRSMDDYPANEAQVNQVMAALSQWKVDARVGTAQKSGDYMVDDKTGTRVTLEDSNGKVLADVFTGRVGGFDAKQAQRMGGHVDTESFGIYVRRADQKDVYFMKGLFLGTFSPDAASYIDRSVIKFDAAKATQLTAACGDKRMVLTKRDGKWEMGGLAFPPDDDEIKRLVDSFAGLSAASLEGKYEAGKYGLEPPACTVQATLDDGTTPTLEIGSEKAGKGYYARVKDAPFVVVISKYEAEAYKKDPAEFARKRLWPQQLDLQAMTVTGPSGTIAMKKATEQQWMIETREVGDVEADFNAAWKVMNGLVGPEVKEWVAQGNEASFGLDRPRVTASGTTKDGKTVTLLIGKDKGDDLVYAKDKDSPWVVAVPKKVLTDLTVSAADLKKKPAPAAPAA